VDLCNALLEVSTIYTSSVNVPTITNSTYFHWPPAWPALPLAIRANDLVAAYKSLRTNDLRANDLVAAYYFLTTEMIL